MTDNEWEALDQAARLAVNILADIHEQNYEGMFERLQDAIEDAEERAWTQGYKTCQEVMKGAPQPYSGHYAAADFETDRDAI